MVRRNPARVVKVQTALNDADLDSLPLVYDEWRQHVKVQRVPSAVLDDMAASGSVKNYYFALWNEILNAWVFMTPPRAVQEQDW